MSSRKMSPSGSVKSSSPRERDVDQDPSRQPLAMPLGYFEHYGITPPKSVQARRGPSIPLGLLAYHESFNRPAATAVQRQEAEAGRPRASSEEEAVHAAAAQGTRDAGATLPHLDDIQRSFGRHDVTQVKAHTGQAATEAARAMGAEAYATGDDVAFAQAPSLHTAAHEAAHVIQQRAGAPGDQDGAAQRGGQSG